MDKTCRHCNSSKLKYSKSLGYNLTTKQKIFTYYSQCLDCKKMVCVKRTPESFLFYKENVKEWNKSKSYLLFEKNMQG